MTRDQSDIARQLLLNESAYWDVPPGETMACVFEENYALEIATDTAVFVAVFGGSCARLFLLDGSGVFLGGGMLQVSERQQWLELFEELLRGK